MGQLKGYNLHLISISEGKEHLEQNIRINNSQYIIKLAKIEKQKIWESHRHPSTTNSKNIIPKNIIVKLFEMKN